MVEGNMFKRFACILFLAASMIAAAHNGLESDVFKTAGGVLRITFIGHASLLFQFRPAQQTRDLNIYVDPDGRLADFTSLPKADLILVSHQHGDHFDPRTIETLRQAATEIIVSPSCLPLPAAARPTMSFTSALTAPRITPAAKATATCSLSRACASMWPGIRKIFLKWRK
jgi:hypothetical protein